MVRLSFILIWHEPFTMLSTAIRNWGTKLALAAAVLAASSAQPACAQSDALSLFAPENLTVTADGRAVAVDGERAWTDGGFGKARYGGGDTGGRPDQLEVRPHLGEAALIWQPQFGWALSANVVALAEGDRGVVAGLSEAYLRYKPLSGGPLQVSARAGLMWPPVSLEHSGPEWGVRDTITPSAINSWIGEEVKVVGAEVTARRSLAGSGEIAATAGLFDFNDTAGALLSFRGWALHDRKALAFRTQPLPPLNAFMQTVQPPYSHPLIDVNAPGGVRPGYYLKLAWDLPASVRVEAIHYDNNADPEAVDEYLEWGWRTRFDNIGLVAELQPRLELKGQVMRGHSVMGLKESGARWVDNRFRAGFAMLTRRFDHGSASARIEAFGTRQRGSELTSQDDEDGWAATLAGRHEMNANLTVLAEFLHVESNRGARQRASLTPRQTQNQAQVDLRLRW